MRNTKTVITIATVLITVLAVILFCEKRYPCDTRNDFNQTKDSIVEVNYESTYSEGNVHSTNNRFAEENIYRVDDGEGITVENSSTTYIPNPMK